MKDPYIRRCKVIRVIDGDTLRLKIDLGWNCFSEHNVRLLRVNAPELKLATKEAGLAAKRFVEDWIQYREFIWDWSFVIRSEKDDAFGRYLVEMYDQEEESLNDALLSAGHATPWA